MPTTQLRVYRIKPGEMDAWTDWWLSKAVPVRQMYGFEILFALIDETRREFIWAVRHDCEPAEFDEVEAKYKATPEHVQLLTAPDPTEATYTAKVTVVVPPGGSTNHTRS